MDRNGYVPYFEPADRRPVDHTKYPTNVDTTRDALPKTQQTETKYTAMLDTPLTRARLQAAFDAGSAMQGTGHWGAMGQIEDEFIREFGSGEGRVQFKRFVESVAAATAGADPRANYLMSHYLNYLLVHDLPSPPTHQLPYPIGGEYAASNIRMFDKTVRNPEWTGFNANNPKRHDLTYDLLGHENKSMVDRQIIRMMLPGHRAPPGDSYGIAARILHDMANQNGVSPRDFQNAVWAYLTRHYEGPFINQINDAIERTHRLTGRPRREILRRGIVRREIPVYGLGGAAIGLPWLSPRSDDTGS